MDPAVPETRSRSRSKTPFTLRSSCDGENCNEATHNHEKPKTKKQPTVQTIVEEKEEPKNDTQRKSARQKIATSDYSSDDTSHSEASKNNKEVGVVKTTTTTTTSKITVKASGAEKSRVSRNVTVSKESSQNSINAAVEKNNKSRSVPQRSTNSSLNSSSSSVEGKDALGYQEYVAAGEYWNKFPKTDYTYSILSPHRRELAPGQIAMPNMSRSGLHKHFERVSNLIRRNPEQEAYIRQRYLSKMQSSQYDSYQRKETQYDSGDEIDNQYRNYSYSIKKESVIRRIFTSIFTFFYTCVYRVTHIFSPATQNYQQYSRFAHEEKGFFGKIGSFISKSFLAIFQKIYLFISTVLYLDSWSLQSKNPDNGNKKRLLLGALVLLPLLLLAGVCYYFDKIPPIPKFELNYQLIDQNKIENVKLIAYQNYEYAKLMSQDSYDYMRNQTQNAIESLQKIWNENFKQ